MPFVVSRAVALTSRVRVFRRNTAVYPDCMCLLPSCSLSLVPKASRCRSVACQTDRRDRLKGMFEAVTERLFHLWLKTVAVKMACVFDAPREL